MMINSKNRLKVKDIEFYFFINKMIIEQFYFVVRVFIMGSEINFDFLDYNIV